jgi:methylthioribulose-1-phosphate dehydratase
MKPTLHTVAREFQEIGRDFHRRGWVLGTSGNFSVVISTKPLKLAITASSVSKGHLQSSDVLVVGADGRPIARIAPRPSAETLLHVAVVRARTAGAVLHTHSVWSTMLSERHAEKNGLALTGFEMLKGLEGVRSHQHTEWLPILDNDQDIPSLARRVDAVLLDRPDAHGFLLRGHGLYTWGDGLAQARRHVEILEFLLETTGRMHQWP